VHQDLYGGSMLCLRFFTVYGPRQRPDLAVRKFCSLISSRRPIPLFGDGSSERDYTWIDDILDGVIAAIDRSRKVRSEYEIINLGASRPVRLSYLVELVAEAVGVEPIIERLPPRGEEVNRTCADLTRARLLLGYTPRTVLEAGIHRFVEWFERTAKTQLVPSLPA
jgi:UDP-glucuronate 4-epimerase